ncbi:MAG: carotenoid 1,2-hydratase [Gammaproteobacteria bacterium]|nr:carotenoid 1,2-hydratase [Gammaproteobacteria bacterium]
MRCALALVCACLPVFAAAQSRVTALLSDPAATGYARADRPREFAFPADHAQHPDYRNEWWYFTGNLTAADGRHFGFQLTFFRRALAPELPPRASAWATNQAWMAHFALTDTAGQRLYAAERFARGALGMAGTEVMPFRVRLDDWQVAGSDDRAAPFSLRLTAAHDPVAIALTLKAQKPIVLQGQQGWDRKGPVPGTASYYYSVTRFAANGRVHIGDEPFAVTGTAWLDREWSSSPLPRGVVGWDWFALQLADGSDLMFYRLRQADGSATAFSSGILVRPDGECIALAVADVRLEPRRRWRSPRSQRQYPVAWRLQIPSRALVLDLEPRLDDQELDLSVRYWEGAISANGQSGGRPVTGQGYLELVGY